MMKFALPIMMVLVAGVVGTAIAFSELQKSQDIQSHASVSDALNWTYVYRLNNGAPDHFYTTSTAEVGSAVKTNHYNFDGIAFQALSNKPQAGIDDIFRLNNGSDHFYTASVAERDKAIKNNGYKLEGTAFFAFAGSTYGGVSPVYRLNDGKDHFYTISSAEKANALKFGYKDEGVAFYAKDVLSNLAQPVYRLNNPKTKSHLLTPVAAEISNVLKGDYTFEGVGFYAYPVSLLNKPNQPAHTVPIYKLNNPKSGDYFYTASADSRNQAIAKDGFKDAGIQFLGYIPTQTGVANAVPVYRAYNATTGQHFFTSNKAEMDRAIANDGYKSEGVGFMVPN